jgi:predicted membrane-bound spermidine synthase
VNIPKPLYAAFALSGVAGLVYEVLWSRYLGLFVGHSAYAQVLVLVVYLSGMAIGSMAAADVSARLARPLLWYAAAEGALAVFGLLFHPLYVVVSHASFEALFPAIGSAGLVGSVRWTIAGALILPQAMVLGATFPLMAASLVRADRARPTRGVARVYLLNTLGGAAGVLLAGFWTIAAFGLPGTSVFAAVLNGVAALLALRVGFGHPEAEGAADAPAARSREATEKDLPDTGPALPSPVPPALRPALAVLLLAVSFGTAVASFTYEIGWIRMLSLALGSATHSFELMLSAFVLGLALGASWIRDRADRSADPVRLLGAIQVLMGIAAVVSVPLFYSWVFDAVAWLVPTLRAREAGYALFNLARYGLALLVMLPATVLAGMTLPLITGTLLRSGSGERAIGHVYAINTMGSVVGAALAGLIALPWLGLKGLILAGAAVDVLLGLWLIQRSASGTRSSRKWLLGASLASGVALLWVGFGFRLDPIVMGSGVYRVGHLPREGERLQLYHADGRTATVSAYAGTSDGVIVLATNGKPDASMGPRWLVEGRDTLPDHPIEAGSDFTTQVLAPMVALAHVPDARNAANIGHGSGISATALLTSDVVERVVTIEIEPFMVEGSLVFFPVNEPALTDPRSTYVFDDAKSYFSYRRERFDLIFSEPSNPWVSGAASLFTVEFYRSVARFVSDRGVFAQWLQIYELDDDLFLSVVAALDAVFPAYRAYWVGDHDVTIVASPSGVLREPDWSVLASERFRSLTEGAPPFRAEHMEALALFDQATLGPLLRRGLRPNSDFRPVLDLGAERARFEQTVASGTQSLGTSRVDFYRLFAGGFAPPPSYRTVPAYGLEPALLSSRAAWLREALDRGGGSAPEAFPEWQSALVGLQAFLVSMQVDDPPPSWAEWAFQFERAEEAVHWGTLGWAHAGFYDEVYAFLERAAAPPPARAAVDFRHGLTLLDWERTAEAADRLIARAAAGERWVDPSTLLDGAVLAYVRTGRPNAARAALSLLVPRTGRPPEHLRHRLLDALVAEADAARTGP